MDTSLYYTRKEQYVEQEEKEKQGDLGVGLFLVRK